MRLNKALAAAGLCSRRRADALIQSGAVAVNGEIVTHPGVRIDPATDLLMVNGQSITMPKESPLYLLMHKPVEVLTTAHDPQGRPTVIDLLSEDIQNRRPFPVGRLDFYSEGLLLLTTDGELANRLTHPRWHVPKTYEVILRGSVHPAALETMRQGMQLEEGDKTEPIEVRELPCEVGRTRLEMVLTQGLNRQIRRMCRDLELTILRLKRLKQGDVELGELPSGHIRPLTPLETAQLQRAVELPHDGKLFEQAAVEAAQAATPETRRPKRRRLSSIT